MRLFLPVALCFAVACSADKAAAPTPAPVDTSSFEHSTPLAQGVDTTQLASLIAAAKAEHSEALIVIRNGKIVYEDYFGMANAPIMAMSATKSIVSLAFGFLVADGKVTLDEPVAAKVPGFANVDSRKATMTYRHLLTMTSGIAPARGAPGGNGDIAAHAIASSLVFAPGASWQYSNNGVDLLSALPEKLAGKPLDVLLNERLFTPMGITGVSWVRDTKGVPLGAGEMSIRAIDLAKIGQMLLDGGAWRGKQIVNPAWIEESWTPNGINAQYGYLWWRTVNGPATYGITDDLLLLWTGSGVSPAITAKLQPMVGAKYSTPSAVSADVAQRLTTAEYESLNTVLATGEQVDGYRLLDHNPGLARYASGWLGQYLVVVPSRKLVAVRMRRSRPSDYTNGGAVDGFPAFPTLIARLAPASQ